MQPNTAELLPLLAILAAINWLPSTDAMLAARRNCQKQRSYKMMEYDCVELNLVDVPQHLDTDLEILHLSRNRIRDLGPYSFAQYGYVKYLYLNDNMLRFIEPNTFAGLRNLEVIDLSMNGLSTISRELFELPLLRNLYISDNVLTELSKDLTLISKPIQAPLNILNLSKCKLADVPQFGPLPDLQSLNISLNPLTEMTVASFSPLCKLEMVDLSRTATPRCNCHEIQRYLRQRSVSIANGGRVDCDAHPLQAVADARSDALAYCAEPQEPNSGKNASAHPLDESDAFAECQGLFKDRVLRKESLARWKWIVIGLVLFFVVFVAALYGMHRHNVRSMRLSKVAPTDRRPSANGGAPKPTTTPADAQADERLLPHVTTKV